MAGGKQASDVPHFSPKEFLKFFLVLNCGREVKLKAKIQKQIATQTTNKLIKRELKERCQEEVKEVKD